MAWIPSYQSLSKHRKTLRAVSLLEVDRHKLIGHLHELWWWALDNIPTDGSLAGLSDLEIGAGADWDGDCAQFVAALLAAEFIDQKDGERYLHDWYDYAGKLNDQRAAERERSRRRRAHDCVPSLEATAGRPPDGPPPTAGTQHNTTQPDRTQPDKPQLVTTGVVASQPARGTGADAPPTRGGKSEQVSVSVTTPTVDETFILGLIARHRGVLDEERVRNGVARALAHESCRKYSDPRAYVTKCLLDDADRQQREEKRRGTGYAAATVQRTAEHDPDPISRYLAGSDGPYHYAHLFANYRSRVLGDGSESESRDAPPQRRGPGRSGVAALYPV